MTPSSPLQSFVLALLVQENMVAILEDDTLLLTHPWGGNRVRSNANNSPCAWPRAKPTLCIFLAPASPNTLHTHRARLFCPPLFFFSFVLVQTKASKSFLTHWSAGGLGCYSRCLYLSQHTSIPFKKHKFLAISGLQEEGPMCTFSLAANLGKCPNSPTSLCLSRRVVSWA